MADNDDREEMVAQFTDVTGVTADRARFYLESANWTLQLALAGFFEQDENNPDAENIAMEEEDSASAPVPSPFFSSASASSGSSKPINMDKDKKAKVKSSSGPRIATIHNMKTESDDDEEQGQAFYTGGSERSGQQILGPPKKNANRDYVSEVFRSAQESGAEVVEQNQDSASGGPSVFVGTGYRLGQTDNDHVTLPGQQSRGNRENIETVILKLWRQGFSINNGELRPYEEPSNKEFLGSIMNGEIPQELRQQGGSMVHVDLEDHRHEEFNRAAVKPKPFAGKGHTLGSPTPNVVSETSTAAVAAPLSAADSAQAEKSASEQLSVNAEQPTTMIQVRLSDGSRLSARFNHSHTVDDIRTYIQTARPQYAGQAFVLLTTFPSKELTDGTESISKAGLLNAAILQRLK